MRSRSGTPPPATLCSIATGACALAALLAVPAARVPVAAFLGLGGRDDDLVALAGPDLVVASGAAICLLGLVRLDVADLDARVFVSIGVGPVVRGSHRGRAA